MYWRVGWVNMARMCMLSILIIALLTPACGKPEGYCERTVDCTELTTECDGATNKCVEIKCDKNSDCRNDWFCNTDTKKCQKEEPAECKTDDDCSNVQKCDNGKCVAKPECEKDGECDGNKECKDNKCVARSCTDNLDCGDNTKYECKDGTCVDRVIECQADADCKDASKPVCKDNKCIEKTGCSSSSECTDPTKPLCVGGKCVEDTGAKEGETCETGKTNCKSGLECFRPDPAKATGTCRITCLTYSPSCEKDRVCQQTEGSKGYCVPPNNGKKEGEECDLDKNPCELDLVCVEWKKKQICAKLCDSTAPDCASGQECYEVIAKKHACVSEREPCGPGRPCEDGFLCENGRCSPPPSCLGVTCKDNEVCEAGQCRAKKCPDEIRCTGSLQCDTKTGTCVENTGDPPCKPCASSTPRCPNTTDQCLTGLGNGSEAFCFEDCSNGKSCPDTTNFECKTISLTANGVTCTTDADCGGNGFTCDSGSCTRNADLCIPKIGTCRNKCSGVKCPSGQKCSPSTGTCITPGKKLCDACTVNDECGGADDLCVNYGNGNTRCGQDCRSQPCPTGYQCFNLQGGTLRQCAPANLMCTP